MTRTRADRLDPGRKGSWHFGRAFVHLLMVVGVVSLLRSDALAAPAYAVPDEAYGQSGLHQGESRIRAKLLVDAGTATAETARIGVLFDLDPGWHIYWRNPGDAGLPTRVRWIVDAGDAGAIHWPAPRSFSEADGLFTTYGYEKSVLLASDITLDPHFEGESLIAAEIDLLVCEHVCIPASFALERSFDAALVDSPDNVVVTRLFDEYAARVPTHSASLGVELESLYDRSALRPGSRFHAAISVRACTTGTECLSWRVAREGVSFFPTSSEPIGVFETSVAPPGGDPHLSLATFEAELAEDWSPDEADDDGEPRLEGVLVLQTDSGERAYVEVDLPLPPLGASHEVTMLGQHWLANAAGAKAEAMTPVAGGGLMHVILLALLGGLILNLMPCVLPILAIKVFGIAELAGRKRREVVASGAAYTLGILSSMTLLAGVVLAVRAAGTELGWGFQFQSPVFIAAIAIVLVAFASNLFGVFEISLDVGTPAAMGEGSTSTRRSFFEGLLAVVLATPCSAPFLGTAVGFAFAGSAVTIVAIFLCIGIGLAAPYLLITMVPSLSRFVPPSGPWMLKLRTVLGFALLATVVWLLWIAGSLSGPEGMTSLLALLVALAFGLWIYGKLQRSERTWVRAVAGISLVLLAALGLNLVRTGLSTVSPNVAGNTAEGWAPWVPEHVDSALDEGRPVLVAFSAEWCITCKVNERVVLRDARVLSELERLQVRVFKADWTKRDEMIRAELARHGRAGVPLYLVYDPRSPEEPEILPELLSIGVVVDSIRKAAGAELGSTSS